MDNFFNAHDGLHTLQWWLGQIVDDSTWKGNELRSKWKDPADIPGFGTRYKVRIFGRDSATKDTPDDQLEMAEILYPVTAGSGHASSFQTANLRKGTYVIGFYKDGIEATEPIIIGCLGNNDQTKLSTTIPLKGFVPFSGFAGGEKVPTYAIPPHGSDPAGGPQPREGGSGSNVAGNNSSDQQQQKDGEKKNPLDSPTRCEAAPVNGIRLKIQNLIKDIEAAKNKVNSWETAVEKPIYFRGQYLSLSEYIQIKIADATKDITKFTKNITEGIHKFVKEQIQDRLKNTYNSLFPNQLPGLKAKVSTANDLIACLFNKIIKNLAKMIGGFLAAVIDKLISVPICAIENFIGGLLGALTGFILGMLSKILGPLEALLGFAFGLTASILGFVNSLLGFLSCDETPACAEVKEWSLWDGAGNNGGSAPRLDVTSIFTKANSIGSLATQLLDPNNYDFNIDPNILLPNVANNCNVGPVFCGPPKVSFFGGGGSGAAANAIISATGDLLGVNIISPGHGYTSPPTVYFVDECGNGSGAVAQVAISTSGTVSNVVVIDPGTGYLPAPNGSRGGEGRTWATRCQSTIKHADGTWEPPYDPGSIMNIVIGDTVQFAGQAPYVSEVNETVSAVPCPPDQTLSGQPTVSNGKYPIYLSVCEIQVMNPGLNYSETDTVVASPNNGLVATPVFGPQGTIEKINVSQCGVGYTERPRIYIQTQTGYNAELVPVFTVNTAGITTQGANIPGVQIIQVIDCVGKV